MEMTNARSENSTLTGCTTCVVVLATILALALTYASLWVQGRMLPSWVEWNTPQLALDLNGDGAIETLEVRMRKAFIEEFGETTYVAPDNWHVFDAAAGDINRDNIPEVVLLVWKQGSYGEARPFWIEHDTAAFSQHVFVFQYRDKQLVPLWMSSDLGFEVTHARLDANGLLELTSPDGTISTWEWQSWGLVLVDEIHPDAGDASGTTTSATAAIAPPPRTSDSPAGTVTLLAVGDNLAHDSVYESAWDPSFRTFDFSPIYGAVSERITSYDIAVINQETPLTSTWDLRSGYPVFATPDSMADALVGAGFNVILCANNHANDQGTAGTEDTLSRFGMFDGITVLGIHATPEDAANIDYLEANGVRLALFNYTYGLNGWNLAPDEAYRIDTLERMPKLLADLAQARAEAGCSIVFLHIGEEYADGPTAEQRVLAAQLLDAGADAVICTHAHVVQPAEWVTTDAGNTGLVCWCLGNFMSNQTAPATDKGAAASLTIVKDPVTGETSIADFELLGTVCRFDENGTRVYWRDN